MEFDHPQLVGTSIVDYKTGKDVYAEAALQLNGLGNCEFIGMDSGEEIPMPKIDNAVVVHIRPEKWSVVPALYNDTVFHRFLGALHTAEWMLKDSKQAIGRPLKWT
jgi:hypothetical protein